MATPDTDVTVDIQNMKTNRNLLQVIREQWKLSDMLGWSHITNNSNLTIEEFATMYVVGSHTKRYIKNLGKRKNATLSTRTSS